MKIIYQDEDIIVVQKEAGLAVQSRNTFTKDLESMLLAMLQNGSCSRHCSLHVINRLDQPVTGLVLFAKNKKSAAALTRQLNEGGIEKKYRAKVTGKIPKDEDTLTDFLIKDKRTNTSRIVAENTPGAKRAILRYVKISDDTLDITLITGRHHQIRVQLSGAGMPILGDRKYGPSDPAYNGRLMLTAYSLAFAHPVSGRPMVFTIDEYE